jgi:hypothetical protein
MAGAKLPADSQDVSYWQGKLRKRLTPKVAAVATAPLDLGLPPASDDPAGLAVQLGVADPQLRQLVDEYDALSRRVWEAEQRGELLDASTQARFLQLVEQLSLIPWSPPGAAA